MLPPFASAPASTRYALHCHLCPADRLPAEFLKDRTLGLTALQGKTRLHKSAVMPSMSNPTKTSQGESKLPLEVARRSSMVLYTSSTDSTVLIDLRGILAHLAVLRAKTLVQRYPVRCQGTCLDSNRGSTCPAVILIYEATYPKCPLRLLEVAMQVSNGYEPMYCWVNKSSISCLNQAGANIEYCMRC